MTWMFDRWRALAAAVLVSVVAVGIGVALSSPAPRAPTPLATSLTAVDTTTMAVTRAPFCDRVTAADVAATLGTGPGSPSNPSSPRLAAWTNGGAVPLGTSTDVAHEYGCTWTAGDRTASAWVFAPPITVAEGRDLIRSAKATKGCTPVAGAPAFGSPSIALSCGDTVSYRGLYGDAWLVCTVRGLAPSVPDLAPRWCASVALAAR